MSTHWRQGVHLLRLVPQLGVDMRLGAQRRADRHHILTHVPAPELQRQNSPPWTPHWQRVDSRPMHGSPFSASRRCVKVHVAALAAGEPAGCSGTGADIGGVRHKRGDSRPRIGCRTLELIPNADLDTPEMDHGYPCITRTHAQPPGLIKLTMCKRRDDLKHVYPHVLCTRGLDIHSTALCVPAGETAVCIASTTCAACSYSSS